METPALNLPAFPVFNVAFTLTPTILLGVLFVFGLFYLIITGILFYHWISYGMGNRGVHTAEILFISVSALFFVFAFLSASYY